MVLSITAAWSARLYNAPRAATARVAAAGSPATKSASET